jgi:superfamily II DNA/RNA helicase
VISWLPAFAFVKRNLRRYAAGFSNPTRVQQRAIPHILNGTDVLIRAETGSG